MICVENVSKSYGSFEALKNISFELGKGEVVGFLGPNGAGKTTTMRIITGFLPATQGRCTIDGISISDNPLMARQKMGYLPENTALYGDMEVLNYLNYVGSLRQIPNLVNALGYASSTCGLNHVLKQKINTLSKGYRQRVGLAQALLHKPDVLILDEPTVGLDPNQIVEIRQLIKNLGQEHTVLLSSHILSEVEQTCTRVLIISQGKIVAQGTPEDLMNQSTGLPVYFLTLQAPRENLIAELKNEPAVESCEILKKVDGRLRVKLTMKTREEAGESLFHLAVKKNWALSELHKEEMSLEDVFKELTH